MLDFFLIKLILLKFNFIGIGIKIQIERPIGFLGLS